jgi:hypothetical protein
MIRERTSAALAAAWAEGRIGGRQKKLDDTKRREIAESVVSGRKSAADMARLYGVSQPTVSRIVVAHHIAPGSWKMEGRLDAGLEDTSPQVDKCSSCESPGRSVPSGPARHGGVPGDDRR